MQLEAPITRVIEMLLTAVTETINPETATLINQVRSAYINPDAITPILQFSIYIRDKRLWAIYVFQAIEILKTTELYEPHLREHSDPGTQELISALLAVRIFSALSYLVFPRRKKRNMLTKESRGLLLFLYAMRTDAAPYIRFILDCQTPRLSTWEEGPSPSDLARLAAIRAAGITNDVCKPIKFYASDEIQAILKKCLDWDFKIFELELLTEKRWAASYVRSSFAWRIKLFSIRIRYLYATSSRASRHDLCSPSLRFPYDLSLAGRSFS